MTRSLRTGCTLTQIYGIGDVGAATIASIVGTCAGSPHAGTLLHSTATTPLDASSGTSSATGTTVAATAS
jgi:hypothetical protein